MLTRTPRFQITKLRVKNFRSIRDSELELGPLTVLVGPNASGKSNLMDVIQFVGDAIRLDLDYALTTRHGIEAVACRQSGTERPVIEIGLEVTSRRYLVVYNVAIGDDFNGGVIVKYEWGEVGRLGDGSDPVHFRIEEGNIVAPEFLADNVEPLPEHDTHFDPTDLAFTDLRRMVRFPQRILVADESVRTLSNGLRELDTHLRGMRFYQIFPNTVRRPQDLLSSYPLLQSGENLASVLRDIQMNDDETKHRLVKSLSTLIPGVSDFRVESAGGFLVIQLRHSNASYQGSNSWFDLTQESDGTLRILALLVALNEREQRQGRMIPRLHRYPRLIGIEEPDLFVHPGALEALADNLKEASARSQVLLTTHSPDLIDQFKTEDVRVVQMMNGITEVGQVSRQQAEAVRNYLFSAGELHSMEGLRPDLD